MDIFNQHHYDGWRMLFLIEGIPTIILGLMAPRILSSIDKAKWLTQQDRDYLHKQLEKDRSTHLQYKKSAIFLDI